MYFSALKQTVQGNFEGGFAAIKTSHLLIAFGGDETNNCNGGNCAAGCDGGIKNDRIGCGGSLNVVAGCGTNT